MKKVLIGLLVAVLVIGGIGVVKGEDIVNAIFYDMDATMDLPENLYDDASLTNAEKIKDETKTDLYVADVNDYLSLRAEPSANGEVLEKLPPQTEMELISTDTAPYVQVYVPSLDKEGYVHQNYIVKKEES